VSWNIKEWLKGNKSGRYHNLLESDINLIFMIRRIFNCLRQLKVLAGRRRVALMACLALILSGEGVSRLGTRLLRKK
jgi:hypothetical protein